MKLFVLTLLVAGSIAAHGDRDHRDREHRDRDRCIESSTPPPCKPGSRRCISTTTTTPTPTTTPTTTPDPLVGCEWCLDSQLYVGETAAGQCFPQPSNGECYCLCGDLFCFNGQIIDRTTCFSGGSLNDCKCIDAFVSTTTSAPTPL